MLDEPLRRFALDPPLTDGTILLRSWRKTDLGCVEEASRDARIPEGTTVPAVYTEGEGLAFVERQWGRLDTGEGVALAIAAADSDEALGHANLMFTKQTGTVSIGYWVIERARGQGLASRAVRLLARWALIDVGLARVEAFVELDNTASMRVLEATGFQREGLLRSYLAIHPTRTDAYVYSLLPTDLD